MQDLCLRLSLQTGILHHTSVLAVQEVEVNDEDIIQQLMEHSNANRSTGSTGANSESSRSHSIMQVSQACKYGSKCCCVRLSRSLRHGNMQPRLALHVRASHIRSPRIALLCITIQDRVYIRIACHDRQHTGKICTPQLHCIGFHSCRVQLWLNRLVFVQFHTLNLHAKPFPCRSAAVLPEKAERWWRTRKANRQDQLHRPGWQ